MSKSISGDGDGLVEMNKTAAAVGLKAAIKALRDGDDQTAAELLRRTADSLESET